MISKDFLKAGHTPTLLSAFFYFDMSFMVWVMLGALGVQIAASLGLDPAQKGLMVAVPVLAGALLRVVNGVLVARARMAPFIVTLAELLGLKGFALVLASQDLLIANPGFFTRIANGSVFGVSNLIWMLVVIYGLGALVLNHTRFGAQVFAIGGNEEAALMLGVRVERVKILVYALSGALAGLSGALLASHLDSGLSGAGTGYELQSIAAAVIGGVLLTGGVGTMAGPLAGVLLLGVIDNVINQVGTLSPYYQNLASGAFLLAAVIVQTVLTGRRHGASRTRAVNAGAVPRRPGS